MQLNNLIQGTFIRRYKRFFVDACLENGEIVTAHSNNTGTMKSLLKEGNKLWLEYNDNPKRKLKYTLHFIQVSNGAIVCVNTIFPNKLVFEAIENKKLPSLDNYEFLKREVSYGKENSRIDIYLEQQGIPTYVEIKNVTLIEEEFPHVAQFPDAVTDRGLKHLKELMYQVKLGHRCIMFYLVNRSDGNSFKMANHIDPAYSKVFKQAIKSGVEVMVYRTKIEIKGHQANLSVDAPLPF